MIGVPWRHLRAVPERCRQRLHARDGEVVLSDERQVTGRQVAIDPLDLDTLEVRVVAYHSTLRQPHALDDCVDVECCSSRLDDAPLAQVGRGLAGDVAFERDLRQRTDLGCQAKYGMGKPTGAFAPRDDDVTVTHLGREDVLGIGLVEDKVAEPGCPELVERSPAEFCCANTHLAVVPREDLQKAQVPTEGTVDRYSSGGLHCLRYCCHVPTFLSCGTSSGRGLLEIIPTSGEIASQR